MAVVEKTLTLMIVSPMLGFGIAFAFAIAIMYFLHQARPTKVNKIFGKFQIASSPTEQMMYKKQ
jgi:phosphate/sulfate permease